MPTTSVRPGTCAACKRNINQRIKPGLQCGGSCEKWFHADCAGLSSADVRDFEDGHLDWICVLCLPPDLVESHGAMAEEPFVDDVAGLSRRIRALEDEVVHLRENFKKVLSTNDNLKNEIRALQFRLAACETNLYVWPNEASGCRQDFGHSNQRRLSVGGISWRWPRPAASKRIVEISPEGSPNVQSSQQSNATLIDGSKDDPEVEESLAPSIVDDRAGAAGAGRSEDLNGSKPSSESGEAVGDANGVVPSLPTDGPPQVTESGAIGGITFRHIVSSTPSVGSKTRNSTSMNNVPNSSHPPDPDNLLLSDAASRPVGAVVSLRGDASLAFRRRRLTFDRRSADVGGDADSRVGKHVSAGRNVPVPANNNDRRDERRREGRERRRVENRARPLTVGNNPAIPLRAAPPTRSTNAVPAGWRQVFVTGLAPDTTNEEVEKYLSSLNFSEISLVRVDRPKDNIPMRYASYRFQVPTDRLEYIVNPDLWPPDVRIKEWLFRPRRVQSNGDDEHQKGN
ncbi:hypothetical protein DMENIID0001_123040 [Sergentomyia squamirostris]